MSDTRLAVILLLALAVNGLALLVGINMGEQEAIFKSQLERKARLDAMRLQIESVNPRAPAAAIAEAVEINCQGIPQDLVLAVIWQESHFNPSARGQAGEIGLMQLNPRYYATTSDIRSNISTGCRVLGAHLERYKMSRMALKAYNGLGGNGRYEHEVMKKIERLSI
jgi:soluble lytic murein transglycosylase-like protein